MSATPSFWQFTVVNSRDSILLVANITTISSDIFSPETVTKKIIKTSQQGLQDTYHEVTQMIMMLVFFY
jgi:hypothetical protein